MSGVGVTKGSEGRIVAKRDTKAAGEPPPKPLNADEQPDFAEEYDHPSGRVDETGPDQGLW